MESIENQTQEREIGPQFREELDSLESRISKNLKAFDDFKNELPEEIINHFQMESLDVIQKRALAKMADNINKDYHSKTTAESFLSKLRISWLGNHHLKLILDDFISSKNNKLEPINRVYMSEENEDEDKSKELEKILTRWVLLEFKITNPELKVDYTQLQNPIYMSNLLKAIENWEFEYKWILWRKDNRWSGQDYSGMGLRGSIKDILEDAKKKRRYRINMMNGCVPGE